MLTFIAVLVCLADVKSFPPLPETNLETVGKANISLFAILKPKQDNWDTEQGAKRARLDLTLDKGHNH